MIRTLKWASLVSLCAVSVGALASCGDKEEPDTEGDNLGPSSSSSADATSSMAPGTAAPPATSAPVATGSAQPSGAPTMEPPASSSSNPPVIPPASGTPTMAMTTDVPLPTDTSGEGPAPTDTGAIPEPSTTSTDAPAPSATEETPDGPPAGAYEACSGAQPPALKLTPVIEDLPDPIFATFPKNDADTMFVVNRSGELRRYDMTTDPPAGVTLLEVMTSTANECGFLSVALHPDFDGVAEKRIYVSYMPTCPASIFSAGGSSTVDEYTVEGDMATFSKTVIGFDQPEGNHNGGQVAFGPDGLLYVGFGDGGGSNDQHGDNGNGQNVNVPLGKILRFDVDNLEQHPAGNLTSADVGGAQVDGRILHYGLRNPWRFSFDQLTGDLYIGDVGQDTREEIDFLRAGAGPTNFGWSAREGDQACSACGHSIFPEGSTPTEPIHAYATNAGGSSFFKGSVTGGYVYRGNAIPALYGRYIFAEFVRSTFFALTVGEDGQACDVVDDLIPGADIPEQSIASFGQDPNGEIYVMNMTRGEVLRIDADE